MAAIECPVCLGALWVCENHLDTLWAGASTADNPCDCGAGAPCPACTPVTRTPARAGGRVPDNIRQGGMEELIGPTTALGVAATAPGGRGVTGASSTLTALSRASWISVQLLQEGVVLAASPAFAIRYPRSGNPVSVLFRAFPLGLGLIAQEICECNGGIAVAIRSSDPQKSERHWNSGCDGKSYTIQTGA